MSTINITEDQLVDAVAVFVRGLTGLADNKVVRGLGNRVPPPNGDHIVLTPIITPPISTPRTSYTDPGDDTGTQTIGRPAEWHLQIDCYGVTAHDRAAALAVVLRSGYGCAAFSNIDAKPLYTTEPKLLPFETGEREQVERWMLTLVMQANLAVDVPQQFADQLHVNLTDVDNNMASNALPSP